MAFLPERRRSPTASRVIALYGQVTYSITDTTRITGGARGSSTERTAHGNEVLAFGGLPYTFDKTYDHADWKVGVEQDLTNKMMAYATVQTGYQPGTFNEQPNTATFSNEVKPQKLLSYTAGLKSRWLDDRLQINDEVYYYDYRDLLIQSYNINAPYNTPSSTPTRWSSRAISWTSSRRCLRTTR